jgi:hypothetical protein
VDPVYRKLAAVAAWNNPLAARVAEGVKIPGAGVA